MVAALPAAVVMLLTLGSPRSAAAQNGATPPASEDDSQQALARQLSNPVADLVSVPFQSNWQLGVGPDDATQYVLNVQPVVPFTLSDDWNLVARVITPVVSQPPLVAGGPTAFGFGDVVSSFFLSPSRPRGLIWGIGPVLVLPTSENPMLGSAKWSAGPTFVVLKQSGPWTYGMLWNQVWSFAGNSSRADVSAMFTQPFLAYTTRKAVTWTLMSEASANWKAESGQQWTVPLMFQVSKLSWFGPFPASYTLGAGYFLDTPDGGPSFRLRAAFTLLLPRRR
jgi:hypothetical protein